MYTWFIEGVWRTLKCRHNPVEQHYFCESYHIHSFWLFKLQQFNIVNDISGLPSHGLHRCRAVCFVTEDESRRGCLLESVSV